MLNLTSAALKVFLALDPCDVQAAGLNPACIAAERRAVAQADKEKVAESGHAPPPTTGGNPLGWI